MNTEKSGKKDMPLNFTKMHSLGNDFVVIDGLTQAVSLTKAQIQFMGDRHRGIGFDQLLIVEPPTQPQFDCFFRIYNTDGSVAEQCGNGSGCFAKFIWDNQLLPERPLAIETLGGSMRVWRASDEIANKDSTYICADMDSPQLAPEKLPLDTTQCQLIDAEKSQYQLELSQSSHEDIEKSYVISAISMGNPHAVIVSQNIECLNVAAVGKAIQQHAAFPKQVNVGFMQIIDRHHIKLRVFERGAGETQACGSGACAAIAAGIILGELDKDSERPIKIQLSGGTLYAQWRGDQQSSIILQGSATVVYEGSILL